MRKDVLSVMLSERLTQDIRDGIIGSSNFIPHHAIIVTWKNVTFIGGSENKVCNSISVVDRVSASNSVRGVYILRLKTQRLVFKKCTN